MRPDGGANALTMLQCRLQPWPAALLIAEADSKTALSAAVHSTFGIRCIK